MIEEKRGRGAPRKELPKDELEAYAKEWQRGQWRKASKKYYKGNDKKVLKKAKIKSQMKRIIMEETK